MVRAWEKVAKERVAKERVEAARYVWNLSSFLATDILFYVYAHIIFKPSVCTFPRRHSAVRVARVAKVARAVSPPTFSSDSAKSAPTPR